MPWQIPVIVVLFLGAALCMCRARTAIKHASDAKDFGNRPVQLRAQRSAKVLFAGAGVIVLLMLGVLVSTIAGA